MSTFDDVDTQKAAIAADFISVSNDAFDQLDQTVLLKVFRTILMLRARMSPAWFIEVTGPFFYKFREEISHRDLQFFIDHDYERQRRDWLEITHGYGESIAYGFEKCIKSSLQRLRDTHPEELVECCTTLLGLYSQYVLLCRKADV